MDPNPLQYQIPNENQPLYRAAGLTAGAMAVLLFVGMSVIYALKHPQIFSPKRHEVVETSPDDAVGDVKDKLTKDAMSTLGGPGFDQHKFNSFVGGDATPTFTPQGGGSYTPQAPGYSSTGNSANAFSAVPFRADGANDGVTHTQVHQSQIRDYGSVNPRNLAAIAASGD